MTYSLMGLRPISIASLLFGLNLSESMTWYMAVRWRKRKLLKIRRMREDKGVWQGE